MIAPEGPFPLSAAQRGIWFAQHIAGDTPISIAQYVELSGEIDHTLLTEAVRQTGREFGTGYLRLVDVDGQAASGRRSVPRRRDRPSGSA